MNRSPKELTDALAFAIDNGGVSTILVGDNELARLVVDWREKDEELEPLKLQERECKVCVAGKVADDFMLCPSCNGTGKLPSEYVVVPREPTEVMLLAMRQAKQEHHGWCDNMMEMCRVNERPRWIAAIKAAEAQP